MNVDRRTRQWAEAIDAFEVAQRALNLAPVTVEVQTKQLNRFASDRPNLAPFAVVHEDVRAWLDSLPCERATMLRHRQSLRSFYRWAYRSGRMLVDPTEEPSRRVKRKPIPPEWEPELEGFKRYLRGIGQPESTINVRIAQLRRLAREIAADPFEVTLDDLAEWLGQKSWAAETRRSHRHAVRGFYAWAKLTGRVKKNPAAKLPKVRAGKHVPRPTSEFEFTHALAVASARERLAVRLAGELGLRVGEVVKVHSSDLLGHAGDWWLVVHGKGNRERRLPVPDELAGAMRARGEGWMFPGKVDGHVSAHTMGTLVSRLLPEGVTMHALRHRFATTTYHVDRDVFSVQKLLGHASPQTTQGYVAVNDSNLRRLVEAARPQRV